MPASALASNQTMQKMRRKKRQKSVLWRQLTLTPEMSDRKGLFEEYEEDGEDEAGEGGEVVPLECLSFEEHGDYHTEHCETDNLLNDFELHKGERASVDVGANSVCRDLKAVFEEGYAPWEGDDADEGPWCGDIHLLELQMAVPGKCHKDIAA